MLKSTISAILRRRGGIKSPFTTTSQRSLATTSNDNDEPLVKTALFSLHKELGGDMVPFAGYELPVLYKSGKSALVLFCYMNLCVQ
jgi:hypothetical protein